MRLVISALTEINPATNRKCWLYLLDYGLKSDVSEAIRSNFVHYASRSSDANTVIVLGTTRHVQNEMLSWHSVFGLPGEKHLPALLACTINPRKIMDEDMDLALLYEQGHRATLIPLSGKDLTVEQALMKLEAIFDRLVDDDFDSVFEVPPQSIPDVERNHILMLEPNFNGIGINFNEIIRRIREKRV